MVIYFSERFRKDYKSFSDDIKKIVKAKLKMFSENPHHPSLRTKKIKGKEDIFETSINMNIRMTWSYYEGRILLRSIGEHDWTIKNPQAVYKKLKGNFALFRKLKLPNFREYGIFKPKLGKNL